MDNYQKVTLGFGILEVLNGSDTGDLLCMYVDG